MVIPITSNLCSTGWVEGDPRHCFLCPAAQYSFNTSKSECDSPCPPNADCRGGASMVPHVGFWVSAHHSDSIVACPNPEACQGNRSDLFRCMDQLTPTHLQVCIPLLLLTSLTISAVPMPMGCIAVRQQMCCHVSGIKDLCMCKCSHAAA